MTLAASNGQLKVVKWLHGNRTVGCSSYAMDRAAGNGHLEVVRWLHENRSEGCTTKAMTDAALDGHFDIVLFLHANRSEGCTPGAVLHRTTCIMNLEMVQWLSEHYPGIVNDAPLNRRTPHGFTFFGQSLIASPSV